jgi:hypothetical protein
MPAIDHQVEMNFAAKIFLGILACVYAFMNVQYTCCQKHRMNMEYLAYAHEISPEDEEFAACDAALLNSCMKAEEGTSHIRQVCVSERESPPYFMNLKTGCVCFCIPYSTGL